MICHVLWHHGKGTLAIFQHQCIQVHQVTNGFGNLIGCARDGIAAKAVANQNQIVQIFPADQVDNILNENIKGDVFDRRCERSASPVCVQVTTR